MLFQGCFFAYICCRRTTVFFILSPAKSMTHSMMLGLRTVIYAAPNLDAAKAWYSLAFATEPYFDEPFYVGFSIGGYELGLDPDLVCQEGSTVTYWGVESIDAAFKHLLDCGATEHTAPRNVGGSIFVAEVHDPFGNILGIIENPEFQLPA
jgi:predicted enzyme related to lactoylglutathione lyase